MVDPIAFQATLDKDTLYCSQAMKADDSQQFKKVAKKSLMLIVIESTGKSCLLMTFLREKRFSILFDPCIAKEIY